MENFKKKDRNFFLFFEFLGTVILTVAFNMGKQQNATGGQIMATTLFVISLVSWEISSAHFNSAVTLGSFIYTGNYKENLLPFIGILFMQIIGSLTGIFMTWYLSLIDEANDQKETLPRPPILCPMLTVQQPDSLELQSRCNIDGLHIYIFMYEFFGSFCFIFTWIVLRNFKLKGDYANHKLQSFIKAMLVALLYLGCVSIGYKFTNFTLVIEKGVYGLGGFFGMIMNPSIALETLIWSHGQYNWYDE